MNKNYEDIITWNSPGILGTAYLMQQVIIQWRWKQFGSSIDTGRKNSHGKHICRLSGR